MPRLSDSLAVRLAVVLLAGLVLLQAAVAAVVIWPDGRPLVFRLPAPRDAAAMARALEAAPPDVRPLVLDALNRGPLQVGLTPAFPEESLGAPPARGDRFPRLFARYHTALEGRPFRVQTRQASGERGPVRLLVRLRTGEILVIQRSATLVQRVSDRSAIFAVAALTVMLLVLTVSLWTVRPIGRLADAARGIADDSTSPDLPVRGVREVRALSAALNDLKRRVRTLLDERTRVLAAIAHDMRTYLTRLRLRAEFIADDDQRARAVADLEEMGQLLDDTLLFARPRPGDGPQVADLRAEIEALVTRRRELGQPVEDASDAGGPLAVRATPLAVRRILDNLVDNAVRYGAAARLRAWREDGAVLLAVDDDGPGAPPEALERLTQPFERLEPSRGRGGGGAGLGLAIVRALAEGQGGALTLANRAEGGLSAVVRLPAA
jgi:two-component system osmolarity sensor histidine kinase EnvZ